MSQIFLRDVYYESTTQIVKTFTTPVNASGQVEFKPLGH